MITFFIERFHNFLNVQFKYTIGHEMIIYVRSKPDGRPA